MAKLGIITSLLVIVTALTLTNVTTLEAHPNPPCVMKEPKTEMVKQACAKGGQKAVKDAMKAFNKEKKIKSCNQCHTKLAPKYELKKDAYDQFKKLGGK